MRCRARAGVQMLRGLGLSFPPLAKGKAGTKGPVQERGHDRVARGISVGTARHRCVVPNRAALRGQGVSRLARRGRASRSHTDDAREARTRSPPLPPPLPPPPPPRTPTSAKMKALAELPSLTEGELMRQARAGDVLLVRSRMHVMPGLLTHRQVRPRAGAGSGLGAPLVHFKSSGRLRPLQRAPLEDVQRACS